MTVRRVVVIAAVALVACVAVACAVALTRPTAQRTMSPVPIVNPTEVGRVGAPHRPLSSAQIAVLPEARYDAVIAGLMASTDSPVDTAYSIRADAPIYGADLTTPVGRFSARNFLGEPTVVVPVETRGEWARVLTPARKALPSRSDGNAPAQTAGWVRTDVLVDPMPLPRRIVVSVAAETLAIVAGHTIEQTFRVGVGASSTPTPQGVTGYLQARYLDPAQNQTRHPVQLTSLHSSAADEPLEGGDGGLIGVHYERTATGAVSHGCIRLSAAAIEAVNALPLGTSISIVG
jgi:lipoprotein-anchoring transpeptidase ErfK/SrfK